MTEWVKWCNDCMMELKKPKYEENDDRFDPNKESILSWNWHETHKVLWRDKDDPNYKKLKRAAKRLQKAELKVLSDPQGLMKLAYTKPVTKEDLPGFFKEEKE